jgi:two-component system OmpR family sensor kinase
VIRRKLVASIIAVVAIVTGVAGMLIVTTLQRRLVDSLDRELAVRTTAVSPRSEGPSHRPPPHDDHSPFDVQRYAFVSVDSSGQVESWAATGPADDPDPLPDVAGLGVTGHGDTAGPITVGSVGDGGLRYRAVVSVQPDGDTLVTAIPLRDVDQAVRTARDIVVVACLLAIAATGAVVWLTVRRTLYPIDQMIGTAERIAEGKLSERAPVPQPASEVGHLGTALNLMLDRIETAVDAKTESEARTRRFAADASHELRTPLTSIRGYAELYRQGARSPDEVALAMSRIEHEAVRMGGLVEDLLLLARLDQRRPLEREPVDLTLLVLDAVAAARASDQTREVRVEVGDEPVEVAGDPGRLRQVVDNLLANVRQHTPAGTTTSVRLAWVAGAATIVVADDGPGMTADDAAHAFDRFWQAGGDAAGTGHGNGLGLAIVAEIVAAHGGRVDVRTAPGQGAAFTVSLPIGGALPTAVAAPTAAGAPESFSRPEPERSQP